MDWRIFYNPLAVFGKGTGLPVAVIVVIVLTAVAVWGGIHLDGALDMHIPLTQLPPGTIVAESLIAWLSLGLILFAASKVVGGNGGAAAHLASTGLARFPYIIAALIAAQPFFKGALAKAVTVSGDRVTVIPQELMSPAFVIVTFATLGLVIWSIAMLYLGYKGAGRVEGGRAVGSFIIGLLVAEVVSKVLLIPVYRM